MQSLKVHESKDPELVRVLSLVEPTDSISDLANIFESEGALEYLYTLTAMDEPIEPFAQSLGIETSRLEMVLKSTPSRRRRYLEAQMSNIAEDSLKVMKQTYASLTTFSKEQSAAAGHHRSIVDSASKLMVGGNDVDTGPKVIVHNNVTIGQNQEPPPLPPELKGIIIDGQVSTRP